MAEKEITDTLNEIVDLLHQIMDKSEINASLTEAILDEVIQANIET